MTSALRNTLPGSQGGAELRGLAYDRCGPGSNPSVDAIKCAWVEFVFGSLLREVFSGYYSFSFFLFSKPPLTNSNSIWNTRTRLNDGLQV